VPSPPDQRQKLDAWCGAAGPPVIRASAESIARPLTVSARAAAHGVASDELVVVTWNVHAGTGDVTELVRRLRSGEFTAGRPATHFVLLLQEAMRSGSLVPSVSQPGVRPPKAAGVRGTQRDIVELSRTLGLSLYYVPSMRNGAPTQTDQDRGNAILSTEELRDFSAIELPFERQRRVAVQASVSGGRPAGAPWTLRLVSAHLESTVPASRLWVMANGARLRQARGLLQAVGSAEPLMLAGDLNTWLGFADPSYRAIDAAIPGIAEKDRRATFAPFFRLDHMFARLPGTWTVTTRRVDDRMGSDHFPIVAHLRHWDTRAPSRAD
jgi:endonuclease/exonuclease/phosphatase family metal-dependent hydrolase